MICDEVQVGMGRSGKLWGYENVGIEPDVFTSAKALGGGVPIGAMMCKGAAAEVFGPGDHASTYGGNPLACAAGLAVANYMCEHQLLTNVQERGDQLSAGLADLAKQYPALLGSCRGEAPVHSRSTHLQFRCIQLSWHDRFRFGGLCQKRQTQVCFPPPQTSPIPVKNSPVRSLSLSWAEESLSWAEESLSWAEDSLSWAEESLAWMAEFSALAAASLSACAFR
jgi:hypothetical protein